jgi:hypothetical protein
MDIQLIQPDQSIQRARFRFYCPGGELHLYYHKKEDGLCEVTISKKERGKGPRILLKETFTWEEGEDHYQDMILQETEELGGVVKSSVDMDTKK